MNPLLSKMLIVIAAVAIVVPATYFLVVQQSSSQAESNPFNYVPFNSELVSEIHINSTTAYVFMINGSAGIILPFSVSELKLASNMTQSNSSSQIQVSDYSSYLSHDVYSIANFSLSSFGISGFSMNSTFLSILTGFFSGNNSVFYASDAGTAGMVIGNLTAVESSISSSTSGNTFSSSATSYLDPSSNYSFFYRPANITSVDHVTGNLSDGHSSIFISLSNNTSLGSFYMVRNGTINVSISSRPGSIVISFTGNYKLDQLFSYVSGYLTKAGL